MEILKEDWGNFKFDSMASIKRGSLLVSNPFSIDDIFRRAVVLITEHNEEHTIGYILNKPIEVELIEPTSEAMPSIIYYGGPVQLEYLSIIHRIPPEIYSDSTEIIEGVYWGGDLDIFQELIMDGIVGLEDIRFMIGYSGWSPGQVMREFENNSWIVLDSTEKLIFDYNSADLWKSSLQGISTRHNFISNLPEDPNFN